MIKCTKNFEYFFNLTKNARVYDEIFIHLGQRPNGHLLRTNLCVYAFAKALQSRRLNFPFS